MIYQGLLTTLRTLLTLGLCAIGNVFLQCALHTILPGVDALALELQRTYKTYHMVDRHTVAQYTTDELGIVPILWIKLLRETLNGGLVATLVLKLEVVAALARFIHVLDNLTLNNGLGQYDTLFVVLQSGEYLVGITIEQSHECHPLLLVVLEANDITVEHLRAHLRHLGTLARNLSSTLHVGGSSFLLLVLLRHRDHYTASATIAIDSTSLASRAPCLDIESVDKLLVNIVGQIDSNTDGVVNPLLDSTLHLHLHQPVNIVGSSLIIR